MLLHKQNFQKAKVRKIKNKIFLNRAEVLGKIRGKMQLQAIHLQDLECCKELFDAEKKGAISLFLNQIRQAFNGYNGQITSQEIHNKVYPFHFDNPKLSEYLANIWNEMFDKHTQILIF